MRMAIGDNYIRGGDYDWGDEIDNNADLVVEGNVGIGTTGPGYKLEVNGDINLPATGFLRIAGNAGSSSQVLTRTTTGMAWQATTGALPAGANGQTLRHDGTNWVANSNLFNNGTQVGIGTTSPGTNKLEVVGGPIKATGGLIIETRTSDPTTPATGQIWLRTDIP